MPTYVQADRPMKVATPLGPDALLLVGFSGTEGISQLFKFELELLAENRQEVPFEKLLGQKVTVSNALPEGKTRFFNGICNRISQGERDQHFTPYQIEIVPQFWLLTKRIQSKIYQHQNVPDILKKIFQGLDVVYELQGTFHPRNYCVQYRESDFQFASRLMEEEGIFYFFRYAADSHKMVVANTPQSHTPIPGQTKLTFEKLVTQAPKENRVHTWQRFQEVRSGKVVLWDHHFQLPGKHLEANQAIQDGSPAGAVNHKFKIANNEQLEIYDYPGGYAGRFDGINRGGGEQPAELQKIFEENKRVTALRMQQEAVAGLTTRGSSTCGNLVSGHRFTLERHFNADGDYVITSVQHEAKQAAAYRSSDKEAFTYSNTFTCIPISVPFRPMQATPRPFVRGTQTAVVVGPAGEEIYTDKYGRIKVQFHWDRDGKYDADSSCWIRVATNWAGKQWGGVIIPRIGQEVIVDFLEGNPDLPIVIGSVYNADQMPPTKLPAERMISGLKSNTYKGAGFNEMTMNDTKGKEKVNIHAQYDMATTVLHDDTQDIKNNRTINVEGTHTETIKKDTTITITEGNYDFTVAKGTATYLVKGDVEETFQAKQTTHVTADVAEFYDANQGTTVKNKIKIQSTDASIEIDGKTQIKLISGDSSITLKADGTIEISGKEIKISGTAKTEMGVGNQNVTCDKQQVGVAGAAITSAAVGKHEISGAVVKLN
jgi:type VI secretion system secreted protein VgrG